MTIVAAGKVFPTFREFISILITFCLTVLAWVFFRADSVEAALSFLNGIFSFSFFSMPDVTDLKGIATILGLVVVFLLIEWNGRENKYAIEKLFLSRRPIVRFAFYYAIILAIIGFTGKSQDFIYFQF
jgi:alginate O-acetyltransferase complex protein AlgI